jgi:hypothetical protein
MSAMVRAGFAEFIGAEFYVIDTGYFDVNINTVKRWI